MAFKLLRKARASEKPPVHAPKPLTMLERARLFARGLAGLELSGPMGPGQQRLDAWCKEHEYRWGVVTTLYTTQGTVKTQVLIGSVYEGEVDDAIDQRNGGYAPYRCHDVVDMALDQIAAYLEENHGRQGAR